MVGLIGLGRRRLPEMSRWLFLAAVAITVVTALLYYPGPIESCSATPDAYWQVAGRCISKTDALYLSTPTRATGLLLGAAFAMLWRPVALMRGPMRNKGRLLDVVAVVGLAGLAALCWFLHIVTPDGADPWLFRGGFLVTGIATLAVIAAVTHRGAHAGRLLGMPILLWIGIRSYGLYLYHWPIYQIIRGVAGNPLSIAQFVVGAGDLRRRRRDLLPAHRDADPQGSRRALVAAPPSGAGSRAAADHRRCRGGDGRPVGVRRGDDGDRRAQTERDRPVAERGSGRGDRPRRARRRAGHRRAGDRRGQ